MLREAALLDFAGSRQATAWFERPIGALGIVDAVQRQQIDMGQLQPLERFFEIPCELLRVFLRRDLRLDDQLLARKLWENQPKLALRRAISARGFDVIDAERDGAVNRGREVVLILGGDVLRRDILPAELVALSLP